MIPGRSKFHTVSAYNLRSLEAPKLAIPAESGTFQDSAARLFNVLPDKLRHETDYIREEFSRAESV